MKKFYCILSTVFLLIGLTGCKKEENKQTSQVSTEKTSNEKYSEEDVIYQSGDVDVYATVTMPLNKENVPYVVICHGHGGSRSENGGLDAIAQGLAEKGIASIRMDYPGCGDSKEQFRNNNLTNMIQYTEDAMKYMADHYTVNKDSVGIFGYSMGGRISLEMLASQKDNFKAVCLLAPAADTEDLKKLFGGTENWELLKKTAQESKDGYADFTTIYGQKQELSTKWFTDLEEKDFATLMQEVKKSYNGPSMVIYAVDDTAVSPSVSKSVAEELGSEIILTPEDGHSYGFYSDKAYVKRIVVENTIDFFEDKLSK